MSDSEYPLIPLDDFKDREIEILTLIAQGASNQEIAETLFITKETVRWYNKQIYSKLGTSRRTEAVALARQMGLLPMDDSSPSVVSLHSNIPVSSGTFWGREDAFDTCRNMLNQSQTRLLSIIGQGGAGKSRLSIELAHSMHESFSDGIFFFELAPLRGSEAVISLLIERFQLKESAKKPLEPILNFCRDKQLLLVFDNFEHLQEASAILTEILKTAPAVKIIVTSRERLNVQEETVYPLQPLATDADKLFIEMAQRHDPQFVIDEADVETLERICELVGYLPLGIILAAAWVDTLTLAEIADEIETSLDFLAPKSLGDERRHRSMQAVFESTWKRLSAGEQGVLMRLSVFRGGFTRKATDVVAGGSLSTLQSLLHKSLVQRTAKQRFDQHTVIREFAREKLMEAELFDATKLAHAQYFHQVIADNKKLMRGQTYLSSIQAVRNELDNCRSALDWTLDGHAIALGCNIVDKFRSSLTTQGLYEEAIVYIENVLKQVDDVEMQIRLLDVLAVCQKLRRPFEVVKQSIDQAFQLIHQLDDDNKLLYLSRLHQNLGELYYNKPDAELALDHFTQGLSYAEALGDADEIMGSLTGLAKSYLSNSNSSQAETFLNRALAIAKQQGDLFEQAGIHNFLAFAHEIRAEYPAAQHNYELALNLYYEVNHLSNASSVLGNLGWLAELQGDLAQARHYTTQSLREARRVGFTYGVSGTSINLGFICLKEGDHDSAYNYLLEGSDIALELGFEAFALEALVGVVVILDKAGQFEQSAELLGFIQGHSAVNHDVEVRLSDFEYRFETALSADELAQAKVRGQALDLHEVVASLKQSA